jgi:2-dehydro-3-deoxyphosphooctonate aldolase (KDO 8-P synthase)
VFVETHPDPPRALCDAASQWPLERLETLLETLLEIHAVRRRHADG